MVKALHAIGFAGLLLVFAALDLNAVPPPNDNHTNRTVLTGNSIDFTGVLADATREYQEYWGCGSSGKQTIWWTWTATETGPVILFENDFSVKTNDNGRSDAISVYRSEDLAGGFDMHQITFVLRCLEIGGLVHANRVRT